jgi:hypothetical protein
MNLHIDIYGRGDISYVELGIYMHMCIFMHFSSICMHIYKHGCIYAGALKSILTFTLSTHMLIFPHSSISGMPTFIPGGAW